MNFKTTSLQPFGLLIEPLTEGQDIRGLRIEDLRPLFAQYHLVVLRGFSSFSSSDDFSDYCESWGEISLWPFGKVLELVEQKNPEDHIFDHNYVPMHWDGMYRPQVPELQVFSCVSAPRNEQGGRTTFSLTPRVIENASPKLRELWQKVTGVYQRKMEFYDSKTEAPIICKHPNREFSVIRYCELPKSEDESFVNHPNCEFKGLPESMLAEFHQSLTEALYHPDNFYAHQWQTGDVVLSDNYTLLHGREAFTSGSSRHLRRVHVLGRPKLDNPHLVYHS